MSDSPASPRKQEEAYPEYNLSSQLLKHQLEMLQFLFYTEYDIIYETFELKHAAYLEKKRGEVVKRFKSEEIARHFDIASERIHIRVLRDDIDLDKQLSRLQLLWHNRNIPFFHRYYFHKYIFTTYFKNLPQLIANEEKLIRDDQHIYFSIFRAINARESCLRQLRRSLAQLSVDDVYQFLHIAKERLYNERRKQEQEKYKIQGYKIKMGVDDNKHGKLGKTKLQFFSDSFNHLTKLTLYVIELVTKWKEYIYSLTHDQRKKKERVEYYYYDDNYFLKILSDLGFLQASFLSNFYEFAPKNDPFLLKCLLAKEKQQEKTLEDELLKQIFMPQLEHLSDIMSKLETLSEEYKHNIRSRKVYDLNALKRPIEIKEQKQHRNSSPKQPISNIVLKKIDSPPPKKSSSLKTFRVRQTSEGKKREGEKIVIEFDSIKKRRRTMLMPGSKEKMLVERETSPLKNSIILERNPMDPDISKLIDSKLLTMLKDEVVRKVKAEFELGARQETERDQALEMYIDGKVKEAMAGVFPYEPEKQLKKPIEFTSRSLPEEDVSSEVVKIYKKSIFRFAEMQFREAELMKKIENSEYVYFVRATIDEEVIGDIVVGLEREIEDYKALRVLYIGFYDLSQMEMLMLRFVEFLWKYENSYEIIYSFLQPTNHQAIEELLQTLQKNLAHNCLTGIKQIYSNVSEVRFIFKRKDKNVNYIPNRHPVGLRITMNAMLSEKKLMLENSSNKRKPELICYDYFLMEIMRKFVQSDDFIILKEATKWKDRLRLILAMIISIGRDKDAAVKLKLTEGENISDLNKTLSKNHELMMEVSDLTKVNLIKLLSMNLTLTLPFKTKSVHDKSHNQCFRYTIHSKVEYWATDNTNFYFFPAQEHKGMVIVFFPAREFLSISDPTQKYLSLYLQKSLASSTLNTREVENMWVPMFRHPEKYQQRQDIYLPTYRVDDLSSIKKDLLIGEQVEYFCSMEMQNGVRYERTKMDLVIEKPFGMGILSGEERDMIYGRIIEL